MSKFRNKDLILFDEPVGSKQLMVLLRKALKQDLRNPILLDPEYHVLSGHLSIIKAIIKAKESIRIWRFRNYNQMAEARILDYQLNHYRDDPFFKDILKDELKGRVFPLDQWRDLSMPHAAGIVQ
jgi:hypothetical protein